MKNAWARSCITTCPYKPGESHQNFDDNHSQKCDTVRKSPYWNEGEVLMTKACVEICPLDAIIFTTETPVQEGDGGYSVNLRGEEWARLGYATD